MESHLPMPSRPYSVHSIHYELEKGYFAEVTSAVIGGNDQRKRALRTALVTMKTRALLADGSIGNRKKPGRFGS